MGVFSFASGAIAGRTAESVAKRVRDTVFDNIQHLTFTYHDQTKTGELIQRSISDIDAIRRFFADQAICIGRTLRVHPDLARGPEIDVRQTQMAACTPTP
jgi:ATP-binding cassette subfamily B protein